MKSTPANGDKFTVFLGGDKTNKVTAGTIEAKEEAGSETPTYALGDVTGDGFIDGEDSYVIDLYSVEYFDRILSEGYEKFWDDTDGSVALGRGDVTGDDFLDGEDSYVIDLYSVEYFDRITSEGYAEFWK